MGAVDLWADEPSIREQYPEAFETQIEPTKVESAPKPVSIDRLQSAPIKLDEEHEARIGSNGREIILEARHDLSKHTAFPSLSHSFHSQVPGGWRTKFDLTPENALVLRVLMPKATHVSDENRSRLTEKLRLLSMPTATVAPTGKHIQIDVPNIRFYREMMNKLSAYPIKSGEYRISMDRALDLEALTSAEPPEGERAFPKIVVDEQVEKLNSEPIPGFTGAIDDLKSIPISVLNVIQADLQTWKQLKKNPETVEEKFAKFGVTSLYDLLFLLPTRHIDKSRPQDISDMIEGEAATVTGVITSSTVLQASATAKFQVKTESGDSISVVFFRQHWLRNRFPEGSEVIVTGKYSPFMGRPSLGGSSIDHADEAALLPIVPVYRQSEAKGITTKLILSSIRELVHRLGDFRLPGYLDAEDRPSYSDTLREIHFPTSLVDHMEAIDDMAYYELVLMQIHMQNLRSSTKKPKGISMPGDEDFGLQRRAIEGFEYDLTDSQKQAIEIMNERMASAKPATVLLNSDVGTGKTVVAQLTALRAVESGYQAVLVAPTEILARQLHATFEKLVSVLGDDVTIGFLAGGIPIKERNAIKRELKDGSIDILIGTHGALNASVKYQNLGFVCIDEQQKFGADQRSALLESREDGRIPDVMSQSATPIPRSVAQVFYGDMEMIELKGRPGGRKTTITEWIEEDPVEILTSYMHPMWADIHEEAAKGNQTFVVTPLVSESPKVDAASAEATFAALKKIFGDRVAAIHGQQKPEKQREIMANFRDGKYDVLIGSSIIEVGVDIPNATRVVILSADRFGAASLHQIRGRVGRSDKQGKCYLVSLGKTDSAQSRLNAMVEFADGFSVAKVDLKIRGEGKMFGTSQSGATDMVFASLGTHSDKIPEAAAEAERILAGPYAEQAKAAALVSFSSEKRLV